MNFSFCICTCNEGKNYITNCIENIKNALSSEDEIIIVDDYSNDKETLETLEKLEQEGIKIVKHKLNNNFAQHKNFLISLCSKERIFLFDADEYIPAESIKEIKEIVNRFNYFDAWFLPRKNILLNTDVNTVRKYKWKIKNNLFNYPDYQLRIWTNHKGIHYEGRLHEQVKGYSHSQKIPIDMDLDIIHIKTQERQIKQHNFYESIKRLRK